MLVWIGFCDKLPFTGMSHILAYLKLKSMIEFIKNKRCLGTRLKLQSGTNTSWQLHWCDFGMNQCTDTQCKSIPLGLERKRSVEG